MIINITRNSVMGIVEGISIIIAQKNGGTPTFEELWASEDEGRKLDIYYREAIGDLERKLTSWLKDSTAKFSLNTDSDEADYVLKLTMNQFWPQRLTGLLSNKVQDFMVHSITAGWLNDFPGVTTKEDYSAIAANDLEDIVYILTQREFGFKDVARSSDSDKPTSDETATAEARATDSDKPTSDETATAEARAIDSDKPTSDETATAEARATDSDKPTSDETATAEARATDSDKPTSDETATAEARANDSDKPTSDETATAEARANDSDKPTSDETATAEARATDSDKPTSDETATAEARATDSDKPTSDETATAEARAADSDKPISDETATAEARAADSDKPTSDETATAEARATDSDKPTSDETATAEARATDSDKPISDETATAEARNADSDKPITDETPTATTRNRDSYKGYSSDEAVRVYGRKGDDVKKNRMTTSAQPAVHARHKDDAPVCITHDWTDWSGESVEDEVMMNPNAFGRLETRMNSLNPALARQMKQHPSTPFGRKIPPVGHGRPYDGLTPASNPQERYTPNTEKRWYERLEDMGHQRGPEELKVPDGVYMEKYREMHEQEAMQQHDCGRAFMEDLDY